MVDCMSAAIWLLGVAELTGTLQLWETSIRNLSEIWQKLL